MLMEAQISTTAATDDTEFAESFFTPLVGILHVFSFSANSGFMIKVQLFYRARNSAFHHLQPLGSDYDIKELGEQ